MPDYNNDQVWNQVSQAYQGWDKSQALHDFYDSRGGDMSKLPGQFGDQYRAAHPGPVDPIAQAQKLRDFTIQSNQPAIQSLQGQVAPLEQRYKDLISGITNAGQSGIDYATRAATTNLGARGIMTNSGLGLQEIGNAVKPFEGQLQTTLGQTGVAEQGQMNDIQNAIAQLQTGNPAGAISGALQSQGLSNEAQQIANTYAIQQAQLQQNLPLTQAQTRATNYVPIMGYGVYDTLQKQLLGGLSGVSGRGVTNVNGVPSLYLP